MGAEACLTVTIQKTLLNHVRLIDLTGIRANEGKLDYDAVVKPFCKVNGCSKKRFDEALSSRE
jgi:hypothetical protein